MEPTALDQGNNGVWNFFETPFFGTQKEKGNGKGTDGPQRKKLRKQKKTGQVPREGLRVYWKR